VRCTIFRLINALPGKWDDCTLKPGQTPVGLGITNESPLVYQSQYVQTTAELRTSLTR
jgi:hypothetical protein